MAEQYRIVAEIEKWFALIDQIEQGKTGLQTIVMQTKSKILDLAIHGKLVPQDPNDEPAFELLKRINPDFTPCDNGHYTQLPKGWTTIKVGDVAIYTNGRAFKPEDWMHEGLPNYYKAGEIIALSGNEGYSFGPHLHMEIRRTDTGELIDPLQFYTDKIKDTTPPRASMIMLYPQRGAGVVEGSQRKKSISVASLGQPVSAWGKIAAGIKAYDYMDGTHNNYGVRSVVLYVDTTEVFRSTVDGVLPEENRMINAWTDYEENVKRHNWVMRSQILPGNSLRMLQANDEGGVVTIDEERDYHFRYELADLYGNKSTYRFIVRGRRQPIEEYHPQVKHYLAWNKGNVVQEPGMELVIPRGMLYEDVALNCHVVKDTAAISYEYQLHDEPVALQAGCTLMIGVRHLPVEDTSKYYVARKWGKRKGSAGGTYENGWMKTSIRELGTYTVAIDTLSPRVTPLNKAQWKTGKVQFKIGDAETGIKDYKVKIDGEFALFGFSSKNAKLWMKHPERLKKGVAHKLELVVTDYCGNETKEEYEF